MKRPEMKYWTGECGGLKDEDVIRNKAIEEYEKFLPSEKKIGTLYCQNCPHETCRKECDMNRTIVVKAFSKRIGTQKE